MGRPAGLDRAGLILRAMAVHDAMDGHDKEHDHQTSDDVLAWFVPAQVLDARERAQDRDGAWWYA